MNVYFLDAGGAGLFAAAVAIGVLFIAVAILIEALVMTVMKYTIFKRSLLHSTICNLVSVAVGALLLSLYSDTFNIDSLSGFAGMLGVTLVVEFAILYGLNRGHAVAKTAVVCLAMNLVTYIILYFVVRYY